MWSYLAFNCLYNSCFEPISLINVPLEANKYILVFFIIHVIEKHEYAVGQKGERSLVLNQYVFRKNI